LPTGLANTCLRFVLGGTDEAYVLRIHTRDPTAAAREQALMAFLERNESPIPVAGLRYACLDTRALGYPYTIWEYVEGTPLQELFASLGDMQMQEVAHACGEVLAGCTAYRFDRCGAFDAQLGIAEVYGPPSRFTETFAYQALFEGRAGGRLGTVMRDEIWRSVSLHAPALREVDGEYCLVHGDFKRSNLVVKKCEKSWCVAAVLDWEFCFAGPPLVDVGNFLRAGAALPPGFREVFVASYRAAGGHLPSDWLKLSRLVDLLSQLEFLGRPEPRPRVFADNLAVIEETLRVLA